MSEMIRVEAEEIKTNFSQYLALVVKGATIIVCRSGTRVATFAPATPIATRGERPAGLLHGQISWTPDAFDPMTEEELREFDG